MQRNYWEEQVNTNEMLKPNFDNLMCHNFFKLILNVHLKFLLYHFKGDLSYGNYQHAV